MPGHPPMTILQPLVQSQSTSHQSRPLSHAHFWLLHFAVTAKKIKEGGKTSQHNFVINASKKKINFKNFAFFSSWHNQFCAHLTKCSNKF
jgi:hypothetical protein